MISFSKCVFLIVIILIVGDTANGILLKNKFKDSFSLRFSLAYGFGTGVFGLLIFYLSYLGFQLNVTNLFFVVSPLLAIFIYKLARGFNKPSFSGLFILKRLKKNGIMDFFLYGLIIISLVLITFKALFLPMHLSDDRAQWGLKAKILYHDKTIYSEDFFDPLRIKLHGTYPFLIPLLESSCYSFMGEMNDRLVKILFPLFFIGLLLFFYSSQRRYFSRRHALVFTAMLAVLPPFIKDMHGSPSTGYADIPFAFYYAVSTISIFNWMNDNRRGDLILAALFITFAIFTKREGLILWVIIIFMMSCYLAVADKGRRMNKTKPLAIVIVLPLILLIPWFHFSSTIPLPPWEKDWSPSYLNPDYISSHFYRIPAVLISMKNNFFGTQYWNILWIIFFMTIGFYRKKSFTFPQAFLTLTIGLNILALVMAIVMYPWDWWYNFPYDMHRLLIINIPLVVYFVSYHIGQMGMFKRS
jgi:hypothetical protein